MQPAASAGEDLSDRWATSGGALIAVMAIVVTIAAFVYSFHLGDRALGAAEAYSAFAASQPSIAAILAIPVAEDPGKQVFYYFTLHYWTSIFGFDERALRSLSVLCALATIVLLYALGRAMFDARVGVAAALIWAFNPTAVLFAHRARMYPMLAALTLAHLLTLWRVRRRGGYAVAIFSGMLGAAAIYTHLAAMTLVAVEAGMLARDLFEGRSRTPPHVQRPQPWIALAISVALLVPYLPVLAVQSQTLVAGHWLDWIGPAREYPSVIRAVTVALAGAIGAWWVFGTPLNSDDGDEPLRWAIAWSALPLVAFIAGSIAIRPILHLRYLTPCLAMVSVVAAATLDRIGGRALRLGSFGWAAMMLAIAVFVSPKPEPWKEIASIVASQGPQGAPIFFESGFVFEGTPPVANDGFPRGYYRIPFDFYFKGANTRLALPAWDSRAARETIAGAVRGAGGGWLITWKDRDSVHDEIPDVPGFHAVEELRTPDCALYRFEP